LRTKLSPALALGLAVVLAAGGCGGKKNYREGTPAATGQVPDCSVAPADLVSTTLKREVTGPVAEGRPDGYTCTFPRPKGSGGGAADQVQLNAHVDNLDLFTNGLRAANNPVKKIKGWGDEAYAATVAYYSNINNFAVRKGKVSVVIISTAGYDEIKALMKAVLAKL
jgi:hypothetical protein